MEILCLRDRPELLDAAARYFASKWEVPEAVYRESMEMSLKAAGITPNWYLMMEAGEITGSFGIIDNDFMADTAFSPWLCALYVEEHLRGAGRGGMLLAHALEEARRFRTRRLYLNTDHRSYYERYGWRYLGDYPHMDGGTARVYMAEPPETEKTP
ncbi:GNAT family N-acetyltransferase [Oscillospiraceae bacterium OttesenSCG-928-F05]|nr:GNAT family N-acetyltransferase [Oscillospiraceae bacterium OttesenSCG-928-F05]